MKFQLTSIILSFFAPIFVFAQASQPTNIEVLQKQIQQLLEQVQALQTKINSLESELGVTVVPASVTDSAAIAATSTISALPEFTKTLSLGARGDEVRKLQEYLARDSEIYPEKLITGYFGPLTQKAVQKLQKRLSIPTNNESEVAGYGVFGPQTRTKIQEIIQQGAGASGVTPSGLLIAPGLQQVATQTSSVATTTSQESLCAQNSSACVTQKECVASGFFWYKVSCHSTPPSPTSCAASYNYCSGASECSANGYYWCRNSCYGTAEACLGNTYVPPAVPATPAQPATQTTQPATPATPATPSGTTLYTISPSVSIVFPQDGSTISYSGTNAVGVTSSDNIGVIGLQFKVNGTNFGTEVIATSTAALAGAYEFSWDTANLTNGSYSFTVTARDAAGNTANSNLVTINLNKSATSTSVTNPSSSSLSVTSLSPASGPNGTVITLTGTGFYNSAYPGYMNGLCFLVSTGGCANAYAIATPGSTQLQFTVPSNTYLPAGTHNLFLQAYAHSSNLTQTFTVTAVTPTSVITLPTVTLAVGYPNVTTQTQPVYVGFNANKEVKVIYEYGLTASYGSIQTVWDQYWTANGAYLPTLSSGTTYHIRAKATDRDGNIGYSQDYIFTTQGTAAPADTTTATTTMSVSQNNIASTLDSLIIILKKLQELLK